MELGDPVGWALALVLLLALPGYAWTRLLLPAARGLELVLLSIGLSIGLMVLALVLGNYLLGIAITPAHAVWESFAIALAAAAVPLSGALYRRLRRALD